MIKLNSREHPWRQGLTVQNLIDEEEFVFKHIVVRVNGVPIDEEDYAATVISDGDDVLVLHLMAGG
ncbi:MAG: sulfur carrier protein ThiS [Chloroflexi bacterium]|nr:sulfur carrier protein ThiS [Chloroflexota bacterium]